MVKNELEQKLDSLLEKGIITQEEYKKLSEKTKKKSVLAEIAFKTLLTIALTILAAIAIVFGACFKLIPGF